jgi:hypothetical protein
MAGEAASFTSRVVGPTSNNLRARLGLVVPPLLALIYPFLLDGFHASAAAGMQGDVADWVAAALFLVAAFAVPVVALLGLMRLAALDVPSPAQGRARTVALLAVTAPTMFVFLGVVLYMLHDPIRDTWIWFAGWTVAFLLVAFADNERAARAGAAPAAAWLRGAHGASALCIVVVYFSLHIINHLFFLAGPETYNAVQKLFRHDYRTEVVQPILVALFLFQVGSGAYLAGRRTAEPMDRFRAFQVASGVFLAVYILGHMDSVFIYGRAYLGIDTNWAFATGAPAGLIKDAWNIRLVPHYGLGVFFVVAHVFAGIRAVMLSHGVHKPFADRLMISGATFGALLAFVIILGMCGARLNFALPS